MAAWSSPELRLDFKPVSHTDCELASAAAATDRAEMEQVCTLPGGLGKAVCSQ